VTPTRIICALFKARGGFNWTIGPAALDGTNASPVGRLIAIQFKKTF
jgi:hypothetical protein